MIRFRLTGIILTILYGALGFQGETLAQKPPGGEKAHLLFIHHSCCGQLLADHGEQVGEDMDSGARCIYVRHPNGGDLRANLEDAGFQVNEASYGAIIGEDTDIHHWHRKFKDQMERILMTNRQDQLLPDAYPTGNGADSPPSSRGNRVAAIVF